MRPRLWNCESQYCVQSYIGQTSRSMPKGLKEHLLSSFERSTISQHISHYTHLHGKLLLKDIINHRKLDTPKNIKINVLRKKTRLQSQSDLYTPFHRNEYVKLLEIFKNIISV